MEKPVIIENGKIWTADKNQPWADTLVVEGKEIKYVGTKSNLPKEWNEDGIKIDCQGKMVMPGLIDSHMHIATVAESSYYVILEIKDTLEEMLDQIKAYAKTHTKEETPYIYATPCPTELLDDKKANRYLLDQYVSDRPVLFADASFHRCLVNSKMLELMEIDENKNFEGDGIRSFVKDENGMLTGMVEEHAYRDHIKKMYDKIGWNPPNVSDGFVLVDYLRQLNKWGVCCIFDGLIESENTLIGMKKLEKEGLLYHYYHGAVLINSFEELEHGIQTLYEWKKKYESDYIKIDTIKFFLDGTNEIGTSAVIEPFCNEPDNYGKINMSEEELTAVFCRLNQEKIHMQIHLVGDRAFRTALNAAEIAKDMEEGAGRKFEMKINLLHCELTKKEDRKRPAELGIYINATPQWSGGIFGEDSKMYLGQERFDSMYAFNEIIDSGAVVGFSSDIVEISEGHRANPFISMQIGHLRIDKEASGELREPKEECLSREALLYGYTYQNALQVNEIDRIGSLEPGKMANLCILSDNLFEVEPDQIEKIEPVLVMFEGKIIEN